MINKDSKVIFFVFHFSFDVNVDLNLNLLRRFLSHKFSASLTSFIRDDGDQLTGSIASFWTDNILGFPFFLPPLTLRLAKVNVDKLSPWLTLLISLQSRRYLLCILQSPARGLNHGESKKIFWDMQKKKYYIKENQVVKICILLNL